MFDGNLRYGGSLININIGNVTRRSCIWDDHMNHSSTC